MFSALESGDFHRDRKKHATFKSHVVTFEILCQKVTSALSLLPSYHLFHVLISSICISLKRHIYFSRRCEASVFAVSPGME